MCYCFPKQLKRTGYSVPGSFLNNLVGFLLPRIYRQFLKILTSFSVEENPQAFVKTWFSEKQQMGIRWIYRFLLLNTCCRMRYQLYAEQPREERALGTQRKFFKKNHSPLEIFKSLIRVSPPIVFLYICKVSNEGIFASKSFRLSKCLLKLVFKFTWQELSKTRKNEC